YVGSGTPLTSLDVTASTINLSAGDDSGIIPTVSTTNGQIYNGPVLLGADATLSDTGGGTITFSSTIDGTSLGDQSLSVITSGTVNLDGYVGANIPLASFGVEATTINLNAGDDNLAEPTVFTAAGQFYEGAVVLGADAQLVDIGGGIYFQSTVSGAQNLVTESLGGPVEFGGNVETLTSLLALGSAVYVGGDIKTTGATLLGGDDITFAGGVLDASTASLSADTFTFNGAETVNATTFEYAPMTVGGDVTLGTGGILSDPN